VDEKVIPSIARYKIAPKRQWLAQFYAVDEKVTPYTAQCAV
jgi:hypothetical protein